MKKRIIISILLAVLVYAVEGQTKTRKQEFNPDVLRHARTLFSYAPYWSMQYTISDAQPTYEDIQLPEIPDPYRNVIYLDSLSIDSLNPIFHFGAGIYYEENDYPELSLSHFQKSLNTMDIKYFNQDSSSYYSFRALIKSKANDSTGIYDLEKALAINPYDSIAASLYFPILITSRDVKKLESASLEALKNNVPYPETIYPFLVSAIVMKRFMDPHFNQMLNSDSLKEYREMDVKTFYDYDVLEPVKRKFKKNIPYQNMGLISDVYLYATKVMLNMAPNKPELIFSFTQKDKNEVKKLKNTIEKAFRKHNITEYTYYFSMGYVNIMQQQYPMAIQNFNRAIEEFPLELLSDNFNPVNCYAGLRLAYWITSDTLAIVNTVERQLESLGNDYMSVDDYLTLAMDALQKNDLPTTENFTLKALFINSQSAGALRLRAHLYFLAKNLTMAEFYHTQALNFSQNEGQAALGKLQLAIYSIFFNQMDSATELIKSARALYGNQECELCDTLEKKYLIAE